MMLRFDVATTGDTKIQPVKERAMSNRTVTQKRNVRAARGGPLAVGVAASAQGGQKPGTSAAAPPAGKRTFAPRLSGRDTVRRRYFPDVDLVTSDGEKVRFYDDRSGTRFVHPELDVREVRRRLPDHDVEPQGGAQNPQPRRRPRHLHLFDDDQAGAGLARSVKDYARMHGVSDPRWLFLTGKPTDVDLLRHKLGFADRDPSSTATRPGTAACSATATSR